MSKFFKLRHSHHKMNPGRPRNHQAATNIIYFDTKKQICEYYMLDANGKVHRQGGKVTADKSVPLAPIEEEIMSMKAPSELALEEKASSTTVVDKDEGSELFAEFYKRCDSTESDILEGVSFSDEMNFDFDYKSPM